ncbi:unnamed protein product [Miscanthus lutarioriparius]|uniref:Uncharacterized protein n=1 Tax=Miscanthus lutarioriparius TaxID=422564 RepID=A0A811R096_9POAL|nr:unnamed protein product [Miscanthus lutarioriparius]
MDPNTKLLVDEMKAMRSALEGCIGGVESLLGKVETLLGRRIRSVESFISERFAKLEDAAQVFDTSKPTIDASVKELRLKMGAIHKSKEAVEKMREEMMALRKTEELVDPSRRRDGRRSNGCSFLKLPPNGAMPLPTPPVVDKGGRDQVLVVEVLAASTGQTPAWAILLSGTVQGRSVTILMDSGSSCSFLSESLAVHLSGASQLNNTPKVRIADSSLVSCFLGFKTLQWEVQDTVF